MVCTVSHALVYVCVLQAEWEQAFGEVSLRVVAMRKSFYGSALFLCRRQAPIKQPIFLSVDAMDYQWVETLKVSPLSVVFQGIFDGLVTSFIDCAGLLIMSFLSHDSPLWPRPPTAPCGSRQPRDIAEWSEWSTASGRSRAATA